jgi:hypothetical protein
MKYFAAILLAFGVMAFSTSARMIDRNNNQQFGEVDNARAVIMDDYCEKIA